MSVPAGTVMLRTRAALLDGAERCLQTHGVRRTTMNAIAAEAGVAKATLYNHFRTKDEVLAATAVALLTTLTRACLEVAERDGLAAGLTCAANELAASATRRALVCSEPESLVPALRAVDHPQVRALAAQVLAAGGLGAPSPGSVDLVLHWLAGQLLCPTESAAAQAALLASALQSLPEPDGTKIASAAVVSV